MFFDQNLTEPLMDVELNDTQKISISIDDFLKKFIKIQKQFMEASDKENRKALNNLIYMHYKFARDQGHTQKTLEIKVGKMRGDSLFSSMFSKEFANLEKIYQEGKNLEGYALDVANS